MEKGCEYGVGRSCKGGRKGGECRVERGCTGEVEGWVYAGGTWMLPRKAVPS